MINKGSTGKCFQCGKDLILVRTYTEIVNNSEVTTTESICSDPACQKRTQEYLRKEKSRREEALNNKANNPNPRNSAANKNLSLQY
jgi:hypothetical protein